MEQTPINVEMSAIKHSLSKVPGVRDVHDLHVWAVSDGKYAMTAHLIVPTTTVASVGNQVIQRCDNILRERFGINHFSI
jgi:cobalt-zinc-cadmium efflux system protein